MKVQDWMTRNVRSCRPETRLNEAAHAMWTADCGVLPVLDAEEKVVGVITDRDLCMGAYTRGRPLAELTVGDSMARQAITCRATEPIEQAIRLMADHQVRRLPVVDGRGKLAGMLSQNDVVRHLVSLDDDSARARLVPRFVEALASICETRTGARVPEPVVETPPTPRRSGKPSPVG